ncbi:MAG: hypothetical protein JOZ57_06030 [Abitibacteriaceae bacterium]|nr:hypothetical protein [Abditibacteriaceae bacterium]
MQWNKRGLIYVPTGASWWAHSYALLPTVEVIEDQFIRIYFSSLDKDKFGRVGYIDVDVNNPSKIIQVIDEPILDLGPIGCFDDSGVNASSVVPVNGQKYMYYIGWQRAERVPYMLFSGLAISDDGSATFKKYSCVPVLDRTKDEPFSRSAPFVLLENGIFKVWYWSCVNWSSEEECIHYNNVIKYTESEDGIQWHNTSHICIAPQTNEDYSVGRPWVIKDVGTYKMWYSIRSKTQPYRISYAESINGLDWIIKEDQVGITRSATGWDSEMVCYPCVVDVKGRRFMFYNGNRHGQSGLGFAELESE